MAAAAEKFIYIIQLDSGKYYVGKTNNPTFRLHSHFNSNGSKWTQMHKPIKLITLIQQNDKFDEDKYTLMYMEKYGIDNVRGGSFCQITLSSENKKTIETMLHSASDKCFKCGIKGHFANSCRVASASDKVETHHAKILSGALQVGREVAREIVIHSPCADTCIKIDKIIKWCVELSEDHHKFYLYNNINKSCYYITDVNITGPEKFISSPIAVTFKDAIRRKGIIDILFDDKDCTLFLVSRCGIKRYSRNVLNKSVIKMIDTNIFEYVEI